MSLVQSFRIRNNQLVNTVAKRLSNSLRGFSRLSIEIVLMINSCEFSTYYHCPIPNGIED